MRAHSTLRRVVLAQWFLSRATAPLALALAIGIAFLSSGALPPVWALQNRAPVFAEARATAPGHAGRLEEIVASLAERSGARILLDPEIAVTHPPRTPDALLPVDRALSLLCASLRGVAWRRLYLPPSGLVEARAAPELLATAVRALEELAPDRLVVENPSRARMLLLLKEQPVTAAFPVELQARKVALEPTYLLYATEVGAGRLLASRLADLQGQQLVLQVREEEMALAMVQMMQLLQNMPPERREPFIGRVGQAGMQLWHSTPPPRREEMLQQSLRLMERFGAPGSAPAPKGSSRPGMVSPSRGDTTGRLKAAAAALCRRCDATLLIDPFLSTVVPPVDLGVDLPLEPALDALVAADTGIAWRRLYLSDAQRKHLQRAETAASLARAVRTLEGLGCGNLVVENAATRRATVFASGSAASAATLEAEKLATRPVYLLYSTTPAAGGATLQQRFGELQRRQMGVMLQMDPAQMTRSMEQLIQTFDGADAATRARLMGLPLSAAMMAVWFPQAAKERQATTGGGNP